MAARPTPDLLPPHPPAPAPLALEKSFSAWLSSWPLSRGFRALPAREVYDESFLWWQNIRLACVESCEATQRPRVVRLPIPQPKLLLESHLADWPRSPTKPCPRQSE